MVKWFNKLFISLTLALSRVQGAIGSSVEELSGAAMHQRYQEGLLAQSLVQGVMTQEVKELRWRIYKIMQHGQGVKSDIAGYDKDGMPIVHSKKVNVEVIKDLRVSDVDKDSYNHKLKMVIKNKSLGLGLVEGFANMEGVEDGEMKLEDYLTTFKDKRSIFIQREGVSQFALEKYAKDLYVYELPEESDKVLLDFSVSKYPDTDDRRSRLFLSELKKIIEGKKRLSAITDFNKVVFVTEKDLGVADYLEFEFDIVRFDKVFEFEGNYVLRFIAVKTIYGTSVLDKFKLDDLEEKYEKKERK